MLIEFPMALSVKLIKMNLNKPWIHKLFQAEELLENDHISPFIISKGYLIKKYTIILCMN